jgi:TAT (twin-arginine translocation) pathway signal sequence
MLSRRDFLKVAGVGAGAMLLNRSTPNLVSSTQAPSAASRPTARSAPTITSTAKKLCFVLWDHQLAQYDYKPRNLKTPVPETCPLYSGAKNPVTLVWETYWRGILHLCNPKMGEADFEYSWSSLVVSGRAFTDSSDPASGDFALHSLTCGGATHEMVTGIPEGPFMQIYTLNSRKNPPQIPAKPEDIDMTRHFFATSGSNVQLPDGSYAVYGFPQFENCIIPLVSASYTDMIDISRIKAVSAIQRPYNP